MKLKNLLLVFFIVNFFNTYIYANEEKLNALKTQLTQIAQVNELKSSQQNDKTVAKQNIKTKNPTQQQVSI